MLKLSTIWIFLLVSRTFLGSIGINTILLTGVISIFQMYHYILYLKLNKLRLEKYYILLIVFFLLVLYNKDTLATFNILLSIIVLRSEKIENILKIIVRSYFFFFIIYLLMYKSGYLENVIKSMPKGKAFTFGFTNSNHPGEHFFNLTLLLSLYLVIRYRVKKIFLLPLIIPNIFIYNYSLSRTSFYSIILFFIFIIIPYLNLILKRINIIKFLPIFLFIITILACKYYYKLPFLDVLVSGRFSINSNYLSNLKYSNILLGYKIPSGVPMDSAYLAQFFAGGLLSIYLFISISQNGISKIILSNSQVLLSFVFVLLISGLFENTFSSFSSISVVYYKLLENKKL